MDELIFPQAVIPMTSLFMMEELVGDKLDGHIYELDAISATESAKPREEKPHRWALVRVYETPHLLINYSFRRYPAEHFSLPLCVELARRYGIGECWVRRLTLRIGEEGRHDALYVFRNKPVTRGSDAERYIFNRYANWLEGRRKTGWVKVIPRRHLPLVSAHLYPERHLQLDWHEVHNSRFVAWLNRVTHGLVLMKMVKRVAGDRLVDLAITEVE